MMMHRAEAVSHFEFCGVFFRISMFVELQGSEMFFFFVWYDLVVLLLLRHHEGKDSKIKGL